MKQDAELQDYFAEASAWDVDRVAQMRKDTIVAYRVATAAGTCATACAIALACVMPLKTVEPYVIRVDSSSGVIDVVPSTFSMGPAMSSRFYWLVAAHG